MAFLRSLFAGVSGLRNHQVMMDVIGNNISNINTVGFKASRTTFGEAFAQTLRSATQPYGSNGGSNPIQVGLGMTINTVDTLFSQGNIETTGQSTDLAIQGNGFFSVVKDGKTYYTRVGTFSLDSEGRLVHPGTGAVLQGKIAGLDGTVPTGTKLESMKIALDRKSSPKATSDIKLSGSLNSNAKAAAAEISGNIDSGTAIGGTVVKTFKLTDDYGQSHDVTTTLTKTAADTWGVVVTTTNGTVSGGTGTAVFDAVTGALTSFTPSGISIVPANGAPSLAVDVTSSGLTQIAKATSFAAELKKAADSTSASVTIYDSLGNRQTLTLKITKSSLQNEWTWSADVPKPSTITGGQSGKIIFNADGTLKSFTFSDGLDSVKINPNNGATALSINLNVGAANVFAGITQTEGPSTVSPREQNGYGSGSLSNISIDKSGKVMGTFSNGTVMALGQVMVAEFNNPSGLLKVGDNMYDVSANSGIASMGIAGESSQSTIVSGALEQSNVDLADEFTKMITAQRGFQSNARVITTSDEFLNEVVNLKR